MLGWALAQLGRAGRRRGSDPPGLGGSAEVGSRRDITHILTSLAEAQALDDKIDDARTTLDEALRANPEELWCRANTLIWHGRLRLQLGRSELAETDFREAIALSQKMRAKSFELRATTSLARLLDRQGKREEARAMLADIYGWFTEGFDTADLKDAKALLDELKTA
jgi:hypothetical protein